MEYTVEFNSLSAEHCQSHTKQCKTVLGIFQSGRQIVQWRKKCKLQLNSFQNVYMENCPEEEQIIMGWNLRLH